MENREYIKWRMKIMFFALRFHIEKQDYLLFFILHSSFGKPPLCQPRYRLTLVSYRNRVSAIFHFSLFTLHFSLIEEKVTPILHSSFFILHLRRATVSGALPPDLFPVFRYFHWPTSTKRQIAYIFRKKIPKSFGSSEKSSTFALAFRKTVLLKQINC